MARAGVLFVAALFVIVPAVSPLVAAEGGALHEFQVEWRVRQAEFPYEGRLHDGGEKTFRFLVDQPNVTAVHFALTWRETDDEMGFSGPDVFALEAADPSGSGVDGSPARGTGGILRLASSGLNEVPSGRVVVGESAADVRSKLAGDEGRRGMGPWTAAVRLEDVQNPQGVDSDAGNEYRLLVVLTYYEASVMRVVSLEDARGSEGGIMEALAAADARWLWGTGALAVAAMALGVFLVVDGARRRSR